MASTSAAVPSSLSGEVGSRPPSRQAAAVLVLLTLVFVGCDVTGPDPGAIESVTVTAPHPLVRALEVTLEEPSTLSVTWEAAGEAALTTTSKETAVRHRVLLSRLLPSTSYGVTVQIRDDRWQDTVVSGPLDPAVAAVRIEGDLGLDHTLTLYEVNEPDGFAGALVVDPRGRIVWYHRTSGALIGSTVRRDGDFVFVDREDGVLVVTPEGERVARLPQSGDRRIHHDVLETEDGVLLFLTTDPRQIDGETIVGDAIWAWVPGSAPERRWSAFDHLSPDRDWAVRSRPGDWLHANSLTMGPRGNHVVSFNFLNQVISLAPDFAEVEWRLGGVNATIPVTGDAVFSGQHTATELSGERVLMFDNGIERDQPFSRALELSIDGGEATILSDLRPSPSNWSRAVSSAFRTEEGRTWVTYGLPQGVAGSTGPVETFVVGPSGEVLGSHRFGDGVRFVYRGSPLESVAGERPVD